MKRQGEITVFLSLCLLSIFALICVMVEGARCAGSRVYVQIAANASLDTLFSQYHRDLWNQYRLFGVEYQRKAGIQRELEEYLNRYFETENWYPLRLEQLTVTDCKNLSDGGGDGVMEEILKYMKYGIWEQLLISPSKGQIFSNDIKEAFAAGTMTDVYEGQADQVHKVEKAVEKLVSCVEKQDALAKEIAQALGADQAGHFWAAAKKFEKEAAKMDNLFRAYERSAQKLRNDLKKGEQKFSNAAGSMQENRELLFREQMEPFQSYTASDGERYLQMKNQTARSASNLELLKETERIVERLEREYEQRERDDDEEDEELSLWEAEEFWGRYQTGILVRVQGEKDEKKQEALEQITRMVKGSLLELVLPDGMTVSDKNFGKSAGCYQKLASEAHGTRNAVDWVLIHEYCGEFFHHALDVGNDRGAGNGVRNGERYELEYLLHGKKSDRENLENTVGQLFLIRQGINLIQILSDSGKRQEAQTLAAVITGLTGLAPLLEVMTCFVMTVWAMGEALMDIRELMAGETISLWKQNSEWSLSLEGLLSLGEQKGMEKLTGREDAERRGGMDYEQYLKLLLFTVDQGNKQTRIMDMIQFHLQEKEPGFTLERCAWSVDILAEGCGKHVFFALPFVEKMIRGEKGYQLEAKARKTY